LNTMNDEGQLEAASTDVLFEWSGQQLTLKSAFSSVTETSRLQKTHDNIETPLDGDLNKSKIRSSPHLFVDYFPYEKA
ncbi:MAG: hypothetical protein J7578_22950, partial [Chitinophagaceae bacterium]|nr:hypothetical protein [Chitinophagaceae bacterium]